MNKDHLEKLYNKYSQISKNNPLYIGNAKKFVCGDGNSSGSIVFIGEAPGGEEEITGIPFSGRSGKLLRFYLNKYNFNTKNSFITNVVKFRPPDNRKPTSEEILIHGALLTSELAIIKPKVIVPIGAVASKFILKYHVIISQIRGTIISQDTVLVFPLFHPAYILRNKNLLPLFENDIHTLQKIIIDNKILF